MAEDQSPDVPDSHKRFVPLENNPEVMSSLVHNLGLSKKLEFHDVFSIDDPELLSFVPRPAYALLLIFPVSETYEKFRIQEDKDRPEYAGSGPDEEVVWYKQTIGNACGLIGLLHGVSNGPARRHVEPGSSLAKLIDDAIPLKPKERADLLYESEDLETAHQQAAAGGDTSAPPADDDVDLHYVCFVKSEANRGRWTAGAKVHWTADSLLPTRTCSARKRWTLACAAFSSARQKLAAATFGFPSLSSLTRSTEMACTLPPPSCSANDPTENGSMSAKWLEFDTAARMRLSAARETRNAE